MFCHVQLLILFHNVVVMLQFQGLYIIPTVRDPCSPNQKVTNTTNTFFVIFMVKK